jgi:hypothetical protein
LGAPDHIWSSEAGEKMKVWQKKAIKELQKVIRKNKAYDEKVRKNPILNKQIGCEVMVRTTTHNGGLLRAIDSIRAVK